MDAYKKFSFYLMLSLLLTTVGAYCGGLIETRVTILHIVIPIILIIAFSMAKGTLKKVFFAIFCFGEGFTLAPILSFYTETSLFQCMILTFLITAMFVVIGYKAKDLGNLGKFLFMALIGFIIYQMIGLFINLPSLAILGVILFSLYIAFDINMFKRKVQYGYVSEDDIISSVMNIYLDIINLFLYLLRLLKDD